VLKRLVSKEIGYKGKYCLHWVVDDTNQESGETKKMPKVVLVECEVGARSSHKDVKGIPARLSDKGHLIFCLEVKLT